MLEGDGLEDRPVCDCLPACEQGMTASGRWVYARELRIGDAIRNLANKTTTVTGLKLYETVTTVYNFEVDDLHNYAVGECELLVHNNNGPEKTIIIGSKEATAKGSWMGLEEAANDLANAILKKWKLEGVGTGARSGQHGIPYARAASELREILKTEGLLPEYRRAIQKKIDKFIEKASEINHPGR